jgi:hypothetical protein
MAGTASAQGIDPSTLFGDRYLLNALSALIGKRFGRDFNSITQKLKRLDQIIVFHLHQSNLARQ